MWWHCYNSRYRPFAFRGDWDGRSKGDPFFSALEVRLNLGRMNESAIRTAGCSEAEPAAPNAEDIAAFRRAFSEWERAVHDFFDELLVTASGERHMTARAICLLEERDRAFLKFRQAASGLSEAWKPLPRHVRT